MAISANSVFEIRGAGSDTNGGGFVTGASGTDFSVQNSKNTTGSNISTTDAVGAGTTTLTSATANFTTAIIGNIIYLQGGTGSLAAGWYQVTARASTTSITVDRTVATGTGITMNIGGALASLGMFGGIGLGTGMIGYVLNSGTNVTVTSSTLNVSGGVLSTGSIVMLVGYTTNRTITNTDAKPTIQITTTTTGIINTRGQISNIIFDGNSQSGARLPLSTDSSVYVNCSIINMTTAAAVGTYSGCSATGNSATVFIDTCYDCEAYANTATPFGAGNFINCLSYNNTGGTTDGFALSGNNNSAKNCIAYGNGGNGFNLASTGRTAFCINCHAENNAGWGFNMPSLVPFQYLQNCSSYNNTLGTVSLLTKNNIVNYVTVTAGSVFTAAGSSNFALNNTASQGALLRAAGAPATFPTGNTASFLDIGAAQHQDTGGTSATVAYTSS